MLHFKWPTFRFNHRHERNAPRVSVVHPHVLHHVHPDLKQEYVQLRAEVEALLWAVHEQATRRTS